MSKLQLRARLATSIGGAAGRVSRLTGRGDGSVIGGVIALRLDPGLLAQLAVGKQIVLVTGTNGKTTTTRLVTAALESLGHRVATNAFGANMEAGLAAALGKEQDAPFGVLEVDEKYVPSVLTATSARVVALLNLSRDQMDRAAEIWLVARRWRDALADAPDCQVVANADDPLIAWAASGAKQVTWVAAGQRWREDSWCCPECGSHLLRDDENDGPGGDGPGGTGPSDGGSGSAGPGGDGSGGDGPGGAGASDGGPGGEPGAFGGDKPGGDWRCGECGFARPSVSWTLDGEAVVDPSGRRFELGLALPGRANRANAVVALAVAERFGIDAERALPNLRLVTSVAGRYTTVPRRGRSVRLLLAKNPAGWLEAFDVLAPAPRPVVLAVNAQGPDGRDTSWLWDVDYRHLRGRQVFVAGERRLDLAVRLEADGVPFQLVDRVDQAVDLLEPDGSLDVIANYTAFQHIRTAFGRTT